MESTHLRALITLAEKGLQSQDLPWLQSRLNDYLLPTDGNLTEQYYRLLTTEMILNRTSQEPEKNLAPLESPFPESSAFGDRRAGLFLETACQQKDWNLFKEILRLHRSQKKLLHPWFIPLLLDKCRTEYHLHILIFHVLGNRASWLSNLREEWIWWNHLQMATPETIPDEDLPAWVYLHRRNMASFLSCLGKLPARARKKLISLWLNQPLPEEEEVIRHMVTTGNREEKFLAGSALLLLNSPERSIWIDFLEKTAVKNIKWTKSGLRVQSFSESIFTFFQKQFPGKSVSDPSFYYRFIPIEKLIGHLNLSGVELYTPLWEHKTLLELCHMSVAATGSSQNTAWVQNLLSIWQDQYPHGNTTIVPISMALESLNFEGFQVQLTHLLEHTGHYFLEKLEIIMGEKVIYIRRDLSEQLLENLFLVLKSRLDRRDARLLTRILPALADRLDPRIFNLVVDHWFTPVFFDQHLNQALWDFKEKIRKRHEIFHLLT